VWDVPPIPAPAGGPGNANAGLLLAELADYVTGKRVTVQGALENAFQSGLSKARERLHTLPPESAFARWIEWFLADRSTRTVSPYSEVDLPHYLSVRAQAKNYLARREAVMLCPTNALALRRLGEALLESAGRTALVVKAEASLLIRRAESIGRANAQAQ
jgi:hypothetical protein